MSLPEFLQRLTQLSESLLSRWTIPETADLPHATHEKQQRKAGSSPPERAKPVQSGRRERLAHWCLGLAAFAIIARLVHIQLLCSDQFAARASRQQTSQEPILARPGDLLDRHGRLLATTISVPSLYVCPARIKDPAKISIPLAEALQLDEAELRLRIRQNAKKQFLWVKRRLSEEEAAAVRNLKLSERQVGFRREFQRHYPQGKLAAHLLGIRNIDGIGRGGVEESLDSVLKGKDGVRRFVRDARGYVLSVLEDVTVTPQDGSSVELTIDVILQLHLEKQLDALMEKHQAKGACAVVMNPRNGEVLALASRPAFDPNHPEDAEQDAWKNMVTSSVFEPGSTFKPLVVAWALDRQAVERDSDFDCEWGAYRMGKRLLRDHHRYGMLSLTDVLVKSSNIGMAKIGEKLGNDELFQMATAFGFGRKTGIELPGELTGLLRPLRQWNSYSTGSIPMGQELAATPLQMISAHATLANGGLSVSPHLILESEGAGDVASQILVTRVVSEESANWIVQGPMREVVQRGTGTQARVSEMEIFGKTGTAQKQAEDGKGYSSSRHLSSFVGGANAGDPQLIVLVSVDEPQGADQYGGSVAAPFVAQILKEGLNVIAQEKTSPSPVKLSRKPEQISSSESTRE